MAARRRAAGQAFSYNNGVQLFPEGSGGVLVAWGSSGGGLTTARGLRVTATGGLASGWPSGGCTIYDVPTVTVGNVPDMSAVPDGLGGLFVGLRPYSGPDVGAWHVLAGGSLDPAWPAGGVPVAVGTHYGDDVSCAADGAGGLFVAWLRLDHSAVLVQRLQSNGQVATGWPAGGRAVVVSTTSLLETPRLLPDGSGGVLVLWDGDYVGVQHLDASGGIAAGWFAGGVAVYLGPAAGSPPSTRLVPSGTDHAFVVWQSTDHVFIQRLGFDGNLDPVWPPDGVQAVVAGGRAEAVSDGADGVILAPTSGTGNVLGFRYRSDATLATGWPSAGVQLNVGGAPPGWAITTGNSGGAIFAWDEPYGTRSRSRVQWYLGDGGADPTQPADGQLVDPTYNAMQVRGLMPDGAGGAYVAWDKADTIVNRNGLMLSRVTYPTPLAVGPGRPSTAIHLKLIGSNPAHDALSIEYSLPGDAPARLELLDLAGRRVRDLPLDGARAGIAHIDPGRTLSPGIYWLRLAQSGRIATARVAILH